MRGVFLGSAAVVLAATPAWAGEKVLTGPPPAWVTPAPPLSVAALPHTGNVLPLFDEQERIEGDTVTAYFDTAVLVSTPEALQKAGTFAMVWQPDHGDLTIHRIEILRGNQVIDGLKGGSDFTVLRRESGLEQLMVTGQLTAVKHIEGLQVGDVLRTSFSISQRDAVLAGNVQGGLMLVPAPLQMGFGRARLVWPTDRPIAWKSLAPGIAAAPRALDAKWSELVIPLPIAKLPETPQNAPARFTALPLVEFSTFGSWGELARVTAPLYSVKGAIAPGSELAARVDAIAARSADPVRRMADALQLVQDEVRYQLVALGAGNYVPQTPADTWSKRYGDCKAKTVLLLAILDRLGIEAVPVLASVPRADGLSALPPSALAFNHVFVRARSGGEDFWLDGTLLGSRLADVRDVPRYGTVLPITGKDATLFDLPYRAHARPDVDVDLAYDMSVGPHLPSPFHLTVRYAGPSGVQSRVAPGPDYEEKLKAFAEAAANTWTDSTTIGKPRAEYDSVQGVWTLAVDGVGYPDWKFENGRYRLNLAPTLHVEFDAPRDRAAWRAIPAVIANPWSAHSHVAITLPGGGKDVTVSGAEPTSLSLPAVAWSRSLNVAGGSLVEEIVSRETGAEVSADQISVTARATADTAHHEAHVALAPSYPQSWDDVGRMRRSPALAKVRALYDQRIADKPDDASRLTDRAWFEERLYDFAGADADYTKAIQVDPTAARYLSRSQLRSKRGDHPGALKDAQAGYDLEQGNKDVRNQLADELALAGRTDDALALLPESPDIASDDGLADFSERIDVLELGDRHADAVALLDAALEKRGNSAELRNARCWYSGLRNKDLASVRSDCDRAVELGASNARYLDSRALVEFRAGELDKARTDYRAALADSPELPSSLFVGGIVLARMGDKATAAAQQRAARMMYPDIDQYYQRFGIAP